MYLRRPEDTEGNVRYCDCCGGRTSSNSLVGFGLLPGCRLLAGKAHLAHALGNGGHCRQLALRYADQSQAKLLFTVDEVGTH